MLPGRKFPKTRFCMMRLSLIHVSNVIHTIRIFEPTHEIMVLFVLRKLILQTRMLSHPVGLDAWFLFWPFVYFHTSCVRTAKALVILRACAGSPEHSLVAYVISSIISWAGSFSKPNRATKVFGGDWIKNPMLSKSSHRHLTTSNSGQIGL